VAGWVDAIFYALLAICGLITLGVGAAVVGFSLRYRRGSSMVKSGRRGGSTWLEATWTGATLLIFLAIFVWAAIVYFRMSQPPANATEIHVIARQWMWKAQHLNGRREINELHLQIDEPVKLVMASQDVIHDFFVPAFRTKQDVVPGRYTTEWFTPTKRGKYRLFCAEYCGMDHSAMGGWVYVLEPTEYARWLTEGESTESVVAAGARLFQARGCSGCHAPNATVRAPLLTGIYMKPVALQDGSVVKANDQYLHDSILLPNKQITAGYEALMPTYQGQLSEEEVMQLVAYIRAETEARP
jgi:cytochrome c oxidase subunit 2